MSEGNMVKQLLITIMILTASMQTQFSFDELGFNVKLSEGGVAYREATINMNYTGNIEVEWLILYNESTNGQAEITVGVNNQNKTLELNRNGSMKISFNIQVSSNKIKLWFNLTAEKGLIIIYPESTITIRKIYNNGGVNRFLLPLYITLYLTPIITLLYRRYSRGKRKSKGLVFDEV